MVAILLAISTSVAAADRHMEQLDRGLVAIRQGDGHVWLSWRMFVSDPAEVAFHVYRASSATGHKRLTTEPIADVTWFVDRESVDKKDRYFVRPMLHGKEQGELPTRWPEWIKPQDGYLTIEIDTPEGYTPNDGAVGDLWGTGGYDLILHQASRGRDNSQAGVTGEPILQHYSLREGILKCRLNLGRNVREGAHYTPFIVYDLDGDGRAEVACKTADGTRDAIDKVIGNENADHRNERGYVLRGPEYLTIFDGKTGQALATTDYLPARGRVADWGDDYGNRVDRFLAGVAYLDGQRPSLITCRGYYTRAVIVAWNWRDGKLSRLWTFDTDEGTAEERRAKLDYRGQGNHSLSIADVDGDGRDEIVYGACVIDDNGHGLYSTKLGHGDALHVTDHDPTRPGLEIFNIHEKVKHEHGVSMLDAKTGEILWSKSSPDVVRGLAIDIDPQHPGSECWASGAGLRGLWNAKGDLISDRKPRSCNFAVWWDGDLQRELLDRTTISKWDAATSTETTLLRAEGCASNNGSKATPVLCADILGDWREEVIWRTADNRQLRIYTSTIPTPHRRPTLMHDSQYRLSVAWQNVGYNQPPHPSFWLGGEAKHTK
jgi:rhamnogalacturonan endolyase